MRTRDATVPKLVRDSLEREGAYDLGLGVVLRAPTDPNGEGGSATYRVEYRVEPVLPGRPLARRRYKYSRRLAKAFAKAQETFEEMQARAGGTYIEYHTDVPFGDVAERWYASPHPRWGEQYPSKVRSLLDTWILADRITVERRAGAAPQPIADVPIGALIPDHYNQALEHVRTARSYRTYTDAHGLVIQILKWARANRYLRPSDMWITDQLPLAVNEARWDGRGHIRAIPPEEIPPTDSIVAFADTAERLFGRGTAIQIYLLAYAGLRISECLALRNDDRFERGDDGCWRIHVLEQVAKSARKTLPPKWRKQRWAFVPHWLSDDLAVLLSAIPNGELLFPSPGRRIRGDDGTIQRVGRGLYPYTNWRARVWDRIAEETPEWFEREDWWPPNRGSPPDGKQSERRWQWSTHALRHASATYLLNDLRLDPDDVAKFLGHRSGVQVWEMYVRVRPNLFGRAGDASRDAGDPRAAGPP